MRRHLKEVCLTYSDYLVSISNLRLLVLYSLLLLVGVYEGEKVLQVLGQMTSTLWNIHWNMVF